MGNLWLIGLDDTDMPDTRGTGRLARALAGEFARRGLRPCGVTRHQLLVHPDVPYTSHNSAACVAVEGDADALFGWVCEYVAADSPEGADPGVCMARADQANGAMSAWGRRAQREVVDMDGAVRTASEAGCRLAGLAGTRQGVIGALAAVGLRAQGEDGRFIDLGRIRELGDRVRVRELLDAGVEDVRAGAAERPAADSWVQTFGWVRPRLLGGRAVLLIEREEEHDSEWVVSDRRHGGQG